MNLNFKLFQFKELIFGVILGQHESIRNKSSEGKNMISPELCKKHDYLMVKSTVGPEMYSDTIYIRGNDSKHDTKVIYRCFRDEAEANVYIAKLRRTLDYINSLNLENPQEPSSLDYIPKQVI